jgi:putative tryptophan/tyrosine transport system substrate-binding protein
MRRREFLGAVGAAAAWPLRARAQSDRVRRIGVLLLDKVEAASLQTGLRAGLGESGFVEGQNIRFEVRSADGKLDQLPSLAAELVGIKVDVIVALFTPSALAAKQATGETPIVFIAGDPLSTGIVSSLARPSSNLTGLSTMGAELQAKCVELLRDMLPSLRRVAALGFDSDPFSKPFVEQVQLAGRATGIEISPIMMLKGPDEITRAFDVIAEARAGAVVMQGTFSTKQVADLALKHRLPAATNVRSFTEAGGLMSYGYQGAALYRHMGTIVGKVLQGTNPANIPIEQPTEFELVINLKTANTMGVTVPATLVARADKVIE